MRETWDGTRFLMAFDDIPLSVYQPSDLGAQRPYTPYADLSLDDILKSGRDLLTDRLLVEGEPSYARV